MFCLEFGNIVMNWNRNVLQKACIQTFSSREEMLCIYNKDEMLICFIIRLYSFNSNHLSVIFILHFFNKCDGIGISKHHDRKKCISKFFKDNNKASHFFFNCGYFLFIFVKRLTKIAIRQIYVIFTFLDQNCTFEKFWYTFLPIVVFTDPNTVTFIKKMQNKNHR
jgi:hypothetical protein